MAKNQIITAYGALSAKCRELVKAQNHQQRRYLLAMIITTAVIAIDLTILAYYASNQHKHQTIMLGRAGVPSAIKPSAKAINDYQVAPNLPKYVVIPVIHVYARITKISTNPQNQIEAPGNIYDAGWYSSSSLPGQSGAMFIDGHVSSWTANGVFHDLKALKSGDSIQIIRGDNKSFTYIVSQLRTYPAASVDMPQVLNPIKPGNAGLNIMTCIGTVQNSQFTERLVVYSLLKP